MGSLDQTETSWDELRWRNGMQMSQATSYHKLGGGSISLIFIFVIMPKQETPVQGTCLINELFIIPFPLYLFVIYNLYALPQKILGGGVEMKLYHKTNECNKI